MKIDFNYQFKTLDGEKIPEKPDEEITDKDGKETTKKFPTLTLRKISEDMLLAEHLDGDRKPIEMSGSEKCERGDLAMRIHKATAKDLADLEVEETALLKKLIAKNYSTLIVWQAFKILDPHGAAEKKTEPKKEPKPQDTPQGKSEEDN